MLHSKLPWAVTTNHKGATEITDARGSTVAKLTALDMANAELIVASVNHSYSIGNKITDINQLVSDKNYWAVDKKDGHVSIVYSEHDGSCKFAQDDEEAFMGPGCWQFYRDFSKNDCDLYGPIVMPVINTERVLPVQLGIMHITEPSELQPGHQYWVRYKGSKSHYVLDCYCVDGHFDQIYLGDRIWATKENPQAFEKWDIFGPVPDIRAPDFEALMTKK